MRVRIWILAVAAGLGAAVLCLPARAQQTPPKDSNPFPEDTNNIPVVPTRPDSVPAPPPAAENLDSTPALALPMEDRDPARSPDDAAADDNAPAEESSSSLRGMDKLLPQPGDEDAGKKHRKAPEPERKPKSKKDAAEQEIEVASYYLDRKNWQAAMSRYESAMVLDPENPDIYYGLALSEQHLGRLASARAHFRLVAEYDPDSRQGKEARKALKDPAIANGQDPKPAEPKPQAGSQP